MTDQQRTALMHPCRLATECTHPRFGHRDVMGYSVVLTVNSGYE
jgi:hypothetical protein